MLSKVFSTSIQKRISKDLYDIKKRYKYQNSITYIKNKILEYYSNSYFEKKDLIIRLYKLKEKSIFEFNFSFSMFASIFSWILIGSVKEFVFNYSKKYIVQTQYSIIVHVVFLLVTGILLISSYITMYFLLHSIFIHKKESHIINNYLDDIEISILENIINKEEEVDRYA